MYSWIEKPDYGAKDQECYGWRTVTTIPSSFTPKQLSNLGKIQFRELKTEMGISMSNQIWLETLLLIFLGNCLLQSIRLWVDDSLSFIPQLVTDEINEQLTGEFMDWEIQEALKQMASLKAPRLDGMPPLFYQHFWGLTNQEVTSTILT